MGEGNLRFAFTPSLGDAGRCSPAFPLGVEGLARMGEGSEGKKQELL